MPPLNENFKQFIAEEIERRLQGDIDLQTTTVEQVKEIIREEVPRILAKSKTTIEGNLELLDSRNIIVGTTTGSKIGTATNQRLGFFNKAPVIQPTALTTQKTTITHTAPGTEDFAIQNLTQTTPFGFVSQDEGNTALTVIANLQTRLSELETRLKNLGLIA